MNEFGWVRSLARQVKKFCWPLSTAPALKPVFREHPNYTWFPCVPPSFLLLPLVMAWVRFLPSLPRPLCEALGGFPGPARFTSSAMCCIFFNPSSPRACRVFPGLGLVLIYSTFRRLRVAARTLRRRWLCPPSHGGPVSADPWAPQPGAPLHSSTPLRGSFSSRCPLCGRRDSQFKGFASLKSNDLRWGGGYTDPR